MCYTMQCIGQSLLWPLPGRYRPLKAPCCVAPLHCNALNYTVFVRCVRLEPKLLRPGLFSVRLVFCLAGSVGVQCAVFFAQCPVCRILYLVFSAVFTVLCLCSVCRGSLSCQHIPERDGLPLPPGAQCSLSLCSL